MVALTGAQSSDMPRSWGNVDPEAFNAPDCREITGTYEALGEVGGPERKYLASQKFTHLLPVRRPQKGNATFVRFVVSKSGLEIVVLAEDGREERTEFLFDGAQVACKGGSLKFQSASEGSGEQGRFRSVKDVYLFLNVSGDLIVHEEVHATRGTLFPFPTTDVSSWDTWYRFRRVGTSGPPISQP